MGQLILQQVESQNKPWGMYVNGVAVASTESWPNERRDILSHRYLRQSTSANGGYIFDSTTWFKAVRSGGIAFGHYDRKNLSCK